MPVTRSSGWKKAGSVGLLAAALAFGGAIMPAQPVQAKPPTPDRTAAVHTVGGKIAVVGNRHHGGGYHSRGFRGHWRQQHNGHSFRAPRYYHSPGYYSFGFGYRSGYPSYRYFGGAYGYGYRPYSYHSYGYRPYSSYGYNPYSYYGGYYCP